MSRRPYQRPTDDGSRRLRKEWVSLADGDVCCWELTTPQMLQMAERSARPAVDPRGGVSSSVARLWMIAFSAHHGEEADSPRIWDDMSFADVGNLRFEEFSRLQAVIERLNGLDPEEVESLRDFTAATGEPKPSASNGSASKTSTDSRKRSTSPITS
jgi:hypothetical protein